MPQSVEHEAIQFALEAYDVPVRVLPVDPHFEYSTLEEVLNCFKESVDPMVSNTPETERRLLKALSVILALMHVNVPVITKCDSDINFKEYAEWFSFRNTIVYLFYTVPTGRLVDIYISNTPVITKAEDLPLRYTQTYV